MEVGELGAIRTQRKVKQEKCGGEMRRPGYQQEEAVQRKGKQR